MKELTVDFICQKLGEYFGDPCDYDFTTKNSSECDVADYMIDNADEFCNLCDIRTPAECWKKYFELRFADENREGANNEKEKSRTGN